MTRSDFWARAFIAKRQSGRFSSPACAQFADEALGFFDRRFGDASQRRRRSGPPNDHL